MSNQIQREVNRVMKNFNKSFESDSAPYNQYKVLQVKQLGRDLWEKVWLLQITKNDVVISEKWFDFHEIVGLSKNTVGRKLFWWVNNTVVGTKNN